MNLNGLTPIRDAAQKNLIIRVEDSLLEYIRTQNLTTGDLLPSQSILAKTLGVSSSTLRETLSRLEERGIIEVEHGKGTYIKNDPDWLQTKIDINLSLTQMIKENGMLPGTRDVLVTMELLPKVFTGCFGIYDPKEKWLCYRRVRTADGKPFAYSVAYLDKRFDQYADVLSTYFGSLYEFIQKQTNECIYETETVIYSDSADAVLSKELNVPLNSPLLIYRQVHSNQRGENLIASRDSFSQSYLKLKVKMRQR